MAYNYLGITWTQINGVLRPVHNEQGNFCLGCEHHNKDNFPICLLCLLLPAQTASYLTQKGWGCGWKTSGKESQAVWASSENSLSPRVCRFPLNPDLDEDWHLWDKRLRIPLDVISLASLLPPGHTPREQATFWWHPSSSAQQSGAISPSYSRPRKRGGRRVRQGVCAGGRCFVLCDQTQNVQSHNQAGMDTPLCPVILLKSKGTELESCWISLSNPTRAHKVS